MGPVVVITPSQKPPGPSRVRPHKLVQIGVIGTIAVILGVLGLIKGGTSLWLTTRYASYVQSLRDAEADGWRSQPYDATVTNWNSSREPSAQIMRRSKQLDAELQNILQRRYGINVILDGARLLVAALLIYGGVRLLALQAHGRKLLIQVILLALMLEFWDTVVQLLTFNAMIPEIETYCRDVDRLMPFGGKKEWRQLSGWLTAWLDACFWVYLALQAAKAAYYAGSVGLLSQELTAAQFKLPESKL